MLFPSEPYILQLDAHVILCETRSYAAHHSHHLLLIHSEVVTQEQAIRGQKDKDTWIKYSLFQDTVQDIETMCTLTFTIWL